MGGARRWGGKDGGGERRKEVGRAAARRAARAWPAAPCPWPCVCVTPAAGAAVRWRLPTLRWRLSLAVALLGGRGGEERRGPPHLHAQPADAADHLQHALPLPRAHLPGRVHRRRKRLARRWREYVRNFVQEEGVGACGLAAASSAVQGIRPAGARTQTRAHAPEPLARLRGPSPRRAHAEAGAPRVPSAQRRLWATVAADS